MVPETPKAQPEDIFHADGHPLTLAALNHSFKARIAQIVLLRGKGLRNKEIAEKLGLTPHSVRTLIWRAGKEGWLKFDDPLERFHNEIVPKVVDNIDYWIDKKDKRMTIEAAKGAGIFQTHQVVKNEGEAPQTILALKIETAPSDAPKVVTGHVVGSPRRLKESNE